MRRRKYRRYRYRDWPSVIGVAFGLGLVFALFFSVRFALFVALVALICVAIFRRC